MNPINKIMPTLLQNKDLSIEETEKVFEYLRILEWLMKT